MCDRAVCVYLALLGCLFYVARADRSDTNLASHYGLYIPGISIFKLCRLAIVNFWLVAMD